MRLIPYEIQIRKAHITVLVAKNLWVIVGKCTEMAGAYLGNTYLHKTGKWYDKVHNGKEKTLGYSGSNGFYHNREEAEEYLKKWFETQPPEVFAAYIAERMKKV